MELELSEDQELFLETTRKLLAAEVSIPAVRALESDPAGFTPTYWRRGAELGWTSMLVPEADGGGSYSRARAARPRARRRGDGQARPHPARWCR